MDDGHIVVDSIEPMAMAELTYDLARESGFASVEELLRIARHGRGDTMYLIRFHYLPPGAWHTAHPGDRRRASDSHVQPPRSRKRFKA